MSKILSSKSMEEHSSDFLRLCAEKSPEKTIFVSMINEISTSKSDVITESQMINLFEEYFPENKMEFNKLKQENADLRETVSCQISENKIAFDKMKQENADLKDIVLRQTYELKSYRENIKLKSDELLKKNNDIFELERENSEVELDLLSTRNTTILQKTDLDACRETIKSLIEKNNNARKILNDKNSDIVELQFVNSTLQDELTTSKEKNDVQRLKLESYNSYKHETLCELSKKNREISELQIEKSKLERKLDDIQTENTLTENEINDRFNANNIQTEKSEIKSTDENKESFDKSLSEWYNSSKINDVTFIKFLIKLKENNQTDMNQTDMNQKISNDSYRAKYIRAELLIKSLKKKLNNMQ
jgi:hypothetical protein